MSTRRGIALALLAAAAAVLPGCAAVDQIAQVGAGVAAETGYVTPEQAASIRKSSAAISRSFEDITPEQEYYIGRSVGAVVVTKYRPHGDARATEYLNVLGQALAQASDRPETFGGYHFLVLDSDEVNAFAAPGGLIFVSRGMLRCCGSEDAVAAVLAHEISHVVMRHGLQAIDKSRLTQALTTLAAEGAKTFGSKDLADLTRAFEGSIGDVTATLMNSGYSRAFEREADRGAVEILVRVGYDPRGLVAMLREMGKRLTPGGADFAKTHPAPDSRIAEIEDLVRSAGTPAQAAARQERFARALGSL